MTCFQKYLRKGWGRGILSSVKTRFHLLTSAVFLATSVAQASADATSTKPPATETAVLPEHAWVQVQNPDGIGDRGFGDTCSVDVGYVVTLITRDGDRVLVSVADGKDVGGGARCTSGTMFFMKVEDFRAASSKHAAVEKAKASEKARVRALLEAARKK